MFDSSFADVLFWTTFIAVIVSSASAVLKAGFMKFDLFGVIMIAITTGLGGGSLRDVMLDETAFWVRDQVFFIASLMSAIAIFTLARIVAIPQNFFLIPDAAGLATFSIVGTLVSLEAGAPWLVASFMGVMTGVFGGILRDILMGERPVVFHSPLYATIAWFGAFLLMLLMEVGASVSDAAIVSGMLMFLARLLALKYNLCLPKFRFK